MEISWLNGSNGPALLAETNNLGEALFGKHNRDSTWNGKTLADLLNNFPKRPSYI
jgi:hypothetical protein